MREDFFIKYKFIKQDTDTKALSFFCDNKISFLNASIVNEMKRIAVRYNTNVRLNLHSSPLSDFHNMIILQRKGMYIRPHKHYNKAETCHIIEGTHIFYVFDENGNVIDLFDMSIGKNVLYRIEKKYYHTSIPTSDFVIFHESKIGPFIREGDSIFAPWAPTDDNKDSVKMFMENLLELKPGI